MTQPNELTRPFYLTQRPISPVAAVAVAVEPASQAQSERARTAMQWVIGFLIFEIFCQLALAILPAVIPAIATAIRVPLRSGAFGASIALIFLLPRTGPGRMRLHPAMPALLCAMTVIALGFFHPHANTLRASLATLAMYIAIASPILWVGRLNADAKLLRGVVITLWAFNSLSALVGTMQTLRPDWTMLQPNLSAVVAAHNDGGDTLKISLANGAMVFRPMGLSDQPGAAAMAGLAAIIFGAALIGYSRNWWIWLIAMLTMVLGLYCILLSQVRSVLVMTCVCAVAFFFVLARRAEWKMFTRIGVALAISIVIGAVWAVVVGGSSVTDRLSTLVQDDPREVYYQNRGHFLEYTFREALPDWPLGAGLGRWGMINYYFGSQDDADSEPLWSEIMWTSWVYDGGAPLMVTYVLAIGLAVWQSWKIATRGAREGGAGEVGLWAAVIFAFNIGCVAVTFNFPLFMGQAGLDFWLLNAALYAAAQTQRNAARTPIDPLTAAHYRAPDSLLGMHA